MVSAGPMRNVPASRSSIAPNTEGPSKRGRHIHSTAPLGATSAQVSQSERNAYSAIGGNGETSELSESKDCPVMGSGDHLVGGIQRGPVGRVAQQRLPDPLAEDPGLAARGAHHGPFDLASLLGRSLGAQPARSAVEVDLHALGGLDGDSR